MEIQLLIRTCFKQGDTLSSYIFNLFTIDLIMDCENKIIDDKISNISLEIISY
jgi:hypothetical protein